MKKITYDTLKETIFFEKLDNGLEVYLLKKEGFNKTYATFTTKYGSIDSKFGHDELVKVPDGIAHFLEHKLFETKDGDVFMQFTKDGANSNAFTSATKTTYLFSTTNDVKKNLNTLLDFVQELYISKESVEKEKGIIEQEIKMYQDDAGWRSYFGTIENMFKENPVRIDIAGSVESVYSITKEDLEYCYNVFYHPSNMLLFVVGNIEPEDLMNDIKRNQSAKDFGPAKEIKRDIILEDNKVFKKDETLKLSIAMPKVMIGIKENTKERPENFIKMDLALGMLLDLLLGASSDKYEDLTNRKVIDDSFFYEVNLEETFGFVMLGGSTRDADKFKKELIDFLLSIPTSTISQDAFERARNKAIGQYLSAFNSLEFIANSFTKYKFEGKDLFELIDELESITLEDVLAVRDFFKEESITTMTIMPK